MKIIREFVRITLKESALVPKDLTDKSQTEFAIGPKAKDYLEQNDFGTTPRHLVKMKNPATGKVESKTLSDIELITWKLNTLDLAQFFKYDNSFVKYSTTLLPASLLKAMAIEETLLGSGLKNDKSSASGVLQVVGGTLDLLNTRRKWLGKPAYTEDYLSSHPEASIRIAAEYINNHMLAPKDEFKGKDGIVRNRGGFNYTIDQMLENYKTGEDATRYRDRVNVYKRLIDLLGGV